MKRIFLFIIFGISFIAVGGYFYARPPMVSVVMPVYNRQDLVKRAIDSILNQTYKDFEFIIVDDGSTDHTPDILQDYSRKDSRIKLLTNTENKGISYSRQRGLDMARGKYVAIMDSDDWSVPNRLEKSVAFMRDHSDIDAMTGNIFVMKKDTVLKIQPDESPYTFSKGPDFYTVELSFFNVFPNVAAMFKKDFVMQHNIRYNLNLIAAEDYDFWTQIILAGGKLASISDILVYVRPHFSNAKEYYDKMYDASMLIHQKLLSRFFTPDANDLKFKYSLVEKCSLLDKMRKANHWDSKVLQKDIETRYTDLCPLNLSNALFLIHPNWSDFIEFFDNNRMKRHLSKDTGTLTRNGDKITIKWDDWGQETFKKQSDQAYHYLPPDTEILHFQHPYWQDQLALNIKTQKVCRIEVPTDCGTIVPISESTIYLHWDNPTYPTEEFQKDGQNNWIFIKSLKQENIK